MKIHVAHSPDSDDAFMFYAINHHKIDTKNYQFIDVLSDIETLNQEALKGTYEVSAISMHAFPAVADKYALLSSGASMGDNYGPIVVAKNKFAPQDIKNKKIAIPGILTSAFLALQLYQPGSEDRGHTAPIWRNVPINSEDRGHTAPTWRNVPINSVVIEFDQIIAAVQNGTVDAGLIIHEGQLTYQEEGLELVLDLGKWWYEKSQGLPLPLGGNVIKKDLGEQVIKEVSVILKESIQYSLTHRQEALDYALEFARDMPREKADKFVGMYVNDLTVDYGNRGKQAVEVFLQAAYDQGLIKHLPKITFV